MNPTDRAKTLLEIVTTPSALVTGTFLAFSGRAIQDNQAKVNRIKMLFALGASLGAVGVSGALAFLMLPLAFRSVWTYRGPIDPILVVYVMITLSVLGTTVYSIWTIVRCVEELRRPSD